MNLMIFILHYYSDLNILNNTHYVINNSTNGNRDNNDNNTQNKYCGNNVCEMKQHGHNVEDIRLVQLITKLLVLIIVNVVITWIFVDIIFNISLVAAAVFELTIFLH